MIGKIEKALNMDDYDLEAVFTPAMVNILIMGFIIACCVVDSGNVPNSVWWQVVCQIIGSVAAAALLTRFVMNLFRATSRLYEYIHYGKDRLHFPTTSMLLYNNKSISRERKKRVRQELKAKYNMSLCSKAQEETDETEARRVAKDAVALIRTAVADSRDIMARRKLKRYGTFRNFLGGALFCFPVAAICGGVSIAHFSTNIMTISVALSLYFVIIVVDYFLTRSAAEDYAETLITTFDKITYNEV